MKKYLIVEEIAFDMHSNDKLMPNKCDVVPDEIILKKIKQMEDLEQTDRDGRTLLINAALYDRKSIIEYLLKSYVNINAKDNMGITALHAAVQEGNLDIIKLLLDNNADVHAKDANGNPPIMKTNLRTSMDVFKILLQYGADPNEKNSFGISAMDIFQAYPEIINVFQNGVVKD